MKKTDITDIRRLAGLQQLNENYIYAAEEEEESTEETEEAIEEIDGDEEGMAAESEVHESSEEDEEDDEEEEDLEEAKSKKAKKDYDGDGKIESEKDEVWGSRMAAAKKAGNKVDEDIAWIMDKVNKLSK
jgi:hypothetical protein